MRERQWAKATNRLGPLVASGRDPQIRTRARELLGTVGEIQSRPAAPPGATGGAYVRLDLRPVAAGETRVRGQFTAVECGRGGIVLIVQSDNGALRLRARQLSEVDFISYRADMPGSVSCGTLPKAQLILATYRAALDGSGPTATAGTVVAIELVPDDFVLR